MTVADKILFTCTACRYRARIPAHYAGRTIHCPGCKSVQPVAAVEEALPVAAPRTAAPVAKLDTPAVGNPILTTGSPSPAAMGNKIVFTCPACNYRGRLAAEYDGKTIRCPGCQQPQVVKGAPAPSPIVASLAADEPVFRGNDGEKIRFACSSCGYRARIPSKYQGKPIHCPQCKQVQVAKPETDLEEATGQTVSISIVHAAAVKEPRLAMTNVGVQFRCAVCGYESRISPSCAGDAIYCPSCRAPQKVEWGDPAALAGAAPAPAAEVAPASPVPAPAALPSVADDLIPMPDFGSEPALPPIAAPAPVAPAAKAPVAAPAPTPVPGAPAEPEPIADATDLLPVLKGEAPAAPLPPPAPVAQVKQGSRRVISARMPTAQASAPAPAPASTPAPAPVAGKPAPRPPAPPQVAKTPVKAAAPVQPEPAVEADAPEAVDAAPEPAPQRKASTTSAHRVRRSVPAVGKPGDSGEVAKPPVRQAASSTSSSASASAPATASKAPLLVAVLVAVLALAAAGALFMQLQQTNEQLAQASQRISELEKAKATLPPAPAPVGPVPVAPADPKPSDVVPTPPSDALPADPKPADAPVTPTDATPADAVLPTEANPADVPAATDAKPVDAPAATDAKPADATAPAPAPADATAPVPAPADATAPVPAPADAAATEAKPVDAAATGAKATDPAAPAAP